MASVPSSALAAAAVSAMTLSDLVVGLAQRLPVEMAVARNVRRSCRTIRTVRAPRVGSTDDVAAIGADLVGLIQAIARAAEANDAAPALYTSAATASVSHPTSASPVLTREYAFARALAASVEVACLGEAFLAEARSDFPDRRAATEARARIATAYDAASDRIAASLGQEVAAVLASVARETSGHLVRLATSLQPVVRVTAARSFPSTALGWSIYGDPARADELVRRNRVGTPLFMPASIEAVAPGAS